MAARRSEVGVRSNWYEVVSMFDGEAKKILEVAGHDVVVRGTLRLGEEYEQLAVCMIPQLNYPMSQLEVIRQATEASIRLPVLLLTDNVQLCRLRRITDKQAAKLMKHGLELDDAEGADRPADGVVLRLPNKDNGA